MDIYPQDHRDYLKNELVRRFGRRPQYSLRAFARDLEISPSTLSDFLNNKLVLSEQRIRELSKKIALDNKHKDHWLDLIKLKYSKKKSDIQLAKLRIKDRLEKNGGKLSLARFKTLTTWYYLCVYHLIQMHPRYQNIEACAEALGVTTSNVQTALKALVQVGILSWDGEKYTPQDDYVLVSEKTPSEHIRLYHSQFIKKAMDSIEGQSISSRELSTCVLTIKKADLDKIRLEIQNFADQMVSKYTSGDKVEELYALTTQFFSLTEKSPRDTKN